MIMLNIKQKQALFQERYHELFVTVYSYLVCRSPNKTVAEDLTSDVFLQAWRGLKSYDENKAELQTWLRTIARRRLARYYSREVKVPVEYYDELPAKVEAIWRNENIDEMADNKRLAEAMMSKLTDEERALCVLRFVDELPYEMIAQRTGQSNGALRTMFTRLKTKAKKLMMAYEQ